MSKCERDRDMDLHAQDILLIGDMVQQAGVTTIKLKDPRYANYIGRIEAVARSRQTPRGLMAALRGDDDEQAIEEFLAIFRARHEFPLDELDPEMDALIEAARLRAEQQ